MFGLITIFFLSVIALFVTANASDEWLDITKYSQDLKTNPILTPSDRFEWILGDPTILDIGDRRYVLANEIFHGIIVYRQSSDSQLNGDEGEFNYEKVRRGKEEIKLRLAPTSYSSPRCSLSGWCCCWSPWRSKAILLCRG